MDDKTLNLAFPSSGVELRTDLPDQPPATTPVGQNVRFFEAITNRGRGGSRAGGTKYITERVNGWEPIQHMTTIVTATAQALGWSFHGRDRMSIPPLPGIPFEPPPFLSWPDFTDDFRDLPDLGGGGGYQPSNSFTKPAIRPFLRLDATALFNSGGVTKSATPGEDVTVTAWVGDDSGNAIKGAQVRLGSDRSTARFISPSKPIAITNADGRAQWHVTGDEEEIVHYNGAVEATVTVKQDAIDYSATISSTRAALARAQIRYGAALLNVEALQDELFLARRTLGAEQGVLEVQERHGSSRADQTRGAIARTQDQIRRLEARQADFQKKLEAAVREVARITASLRSVIEQQKHSGKTTTKRVIRARTNNVDVTYSGGTVSLSVDNSSPANSTPAILTATTGNIGEFVAIRISPSGSLEAGGLTDMNGQFTASVQFNNSTVTFYAELGTPVIATSNFLAVTWS